MTLLTQAQIRAGLRGLKGWNVKDGFLQKEFKFRRFMDGIRFVDRVAELAESLEHHPDVHIRWTTVTLMVQSHDEGGITARDIDLVKAIERNLGQR